MLYLRVFISRTLYQHFFLQFHTYIYSVYKLNLLWRKVQSIFSKPLLSNKNELIEFLKENDFQMTQKSFTYALYSSARIDPRFTHWIFSVYPSILAKKNFSKLEFDAKISSVDINNLTQELLSTCTEKNEASSSLTSLLGNPQTSKFINWKNITGFNNPPKTHLHTTEAYNAVLFCCAINYDVPASLHYFEHMKAKKISINATSLLYLSVACNKNTHRRIALDLILPLLLSSDYCTERMDAINECLMVLANCGDVLCFKRLFEYMNKLELEPPIVYNAGY
jgi:hypothetical protein